MLLNLRSRKRPVSLSPSAAGGEGQGRGGSFPKQPRNPEFLSGSIRSYPWSNCSPGGRLTRGSGRAHFRPLLPLREEGRVEEGFGI